MATIRMLSTPTFKASLDTVGANEMRLTLIGKLNEDVNFGIILKQLQAGFAARNQLSFDVSGIDTINSAGAREWLLFLERLQLAVNIRFDNVSESFVSNAIITPNFLGKIGTPVRLFALPYFCGTCDARTEITVNSENFPAGKPFAAPEQKCATCGARLDFDSLEAEYEVFLKHTHAAR